eukprot:5960472-Prymnesium_polylepis.1
MLQRFTESDTVSSDDNPDNLLEQAMAAINEARRVVAGDVDAAVLNRELDELEAELRAAHAQAAVAQREQMAFSQSQPVFDDEDDMEMEEEPQSSAPPGLSDSQLADDQYVLERILGRRRKKGKKGKGS